VCSNSSTATAASQDTKLAMCALQYGGSEAHSTFFQRQRGDWEAATQSRDLMTSIRRFYSNAYTDADKQAAINLFLGNFGAFHPIERLLSRGTDELSAGKPRSIPVDRLFDGISVV